MGDLRCGSPVPGEIPIKAGSRAEGGIRTYFILGSGLGPNRLMKVCLAVKQMLWNKVEDETMQIKPRQTIRGQGH